MTVNERPARPMRRRPLLMSVVGAVVGAALIVCGGILPAEYNRDPLGLGRLTGISRLWTPDERRVDTKGGAVAYAREYDVPYRSDTVEIPLGGFLTGSDNSELEYKVRVKTGATFTYAWEVVGAADPRDFHFDQHGHTTPKAGASMTVATFKQGFGLTQQGAVTSPFDGIQGWQFSNSSEQPVVVKLRLSGFYELIAGGEAGNEAGVIANVPASQSRPQAPAALKAAP